MMSAEHRGAHPGEAPTTGASTTEAHVTVPAGLSEPLRCDRYLAEVVGLLNRSQLKSRVVELRINGTVGRLSKTVSAGDEIWMRYRLPESAGISPQPVAFTVLYEDEAVVVIDKPQGIAVHAGSGGNAPTLVDGLVYARPSLLTRFPDDSIRPGIAHRLDKETSGVMVVAKSEAVRAALTEAFSGREVHKRYIAIVKGHLPQRNGKVRGYIGRDPHNRKRFSLFEDERSGKYAETDYRVVRAFDHYSLVELSPKTGRTHQLRVHMASLGTPILGDPLYARHDPQQPEASMMLHAYSIRLQLPGASDGAEFTAPFPARFRGIMSALKRGSSR